MTDEDRLVRLRVRSIELSVRQSCLSNRFSYASAEFSRLLAEGGSREAIEEARLLSSAIFESQLDLCIEAAAVRHELEGG